MACIPMAWATPVLLAMTQHSGRIRAPGCSEDPETRTIRCLPGGMRASTEQQLKALGLISSGDSLSLDTYSMARNIASEAGTGSLAEKAAMAQAALNRARQDGISISRLVMRDGKFYARQSGINPRVASIQDPTWADIVLAQAAVNGELEGFIRGATHYFSPKDQDGLYRQGRVSKDRWAIYELWVRRDSLAWVGPVPGIDPEKQFLMRRSVVNSPEWITQYHIGKQVLADRPGAPENVCEPRGMNLRLVATIAGVTAIAAAGVYLYRQASG